MSKKTLVSAITAALVVGAASTTFAAANPFSDVPADSWAYDAVTTLAADGVIDGYPDGTYKGQNTMTRYEMAQIVARAMAKTDLEKADKALVDKLAAEFAEELDNLGVRVADLEKKSDNVKWGGELRYRYWDADHDAKADETYNKVMFRLEPKAYIGNSGWTANARIGYVADLSSDSNAEFAHGDGDDNDAGVDRIYVEGPLAGATVQAGRLPVFTAQGMLFDDRISGAQVAFGSDVFKTTLAGGRYSEEGHAYAPNENAKLVTAEYYGVQFDWAPTEKIAANAGYTQLTGIDSNATTHQFALGDDDSLGIWYVGGSYAFDSNVKLVGQYAESDADAYEKAGSVEVQYKGADAADAGSWGAYFGYRHLGDNVAIAPTYDDAAANQKGYVVGASYVPAENILATIEYFDGKDMDTDTDASKFFANVDFFF
ncbi:S-layer homology domain-containing protein [uncultured Megamonas sp.]|uniref:S-layer homology domain-containing protein n=1 Tax=uncultured Megamonas sp. TaxID=286140 RepID=UPI00267026DA|nr:S-layer homology domain-containing protein [uncultured Megamonas sp.]